MFLTTGEIHSAVTPSVCEVVELVDHALPVAAVVLAGHLRLDVDVVVRIAVREPVDHDLVDDLIAPVDVRVARCGRSDGCSTSDAPPHAASEGENAGESARHGGHGEHDSCPGMPLEINMLLITVETDALRFATTAALRRRLTARSALRASPGTSRDGAAAELCVALFCWLLS